MMDRRKEEVTLASPNAKSPNNAPIENNNNGLKNNVNLPWLQWRQYESRDNAKPDLLHLKVLEIETFETKYSTAVKVLLKEGNKLEPCFVSLKSKASPNSKLLDLWDENVAKGRIQPGKEFVLETWKRESKKTSGKTVRDYDMRFDEGLHQCSSSSSSSSFSSSSKVGSELE
jgi:hypothetical protein